MYNNSNIQWHAGMELTTDVFRNLEQDLTERQRVTVRAAISDGRIGVLPDTELHVEGGFVKRSLEMTGLRITAITASGKLIAVDDDLKIDIPKLEGTEYFLCVGASDTEKRSFERDGILYEAPLYELSIVEADNIDGADVMPLKHLLIDDGTLTIDHDYIIPSLSLKTEKNFEEFRDKYVTLLETIVTHKNMDEGDCKRTLLSLLFRLKTLSMARPVRDFVDLLQEIALTVRYYVTEGLGAALDSCPDKPKALLDDARSTPSQYNIAAYLKWVEEYLLAQQEIMSQVVIVDNSIDYDKLKTELHDEIFVKLRDDLYLQLYQQLHDTLATEIHDSIMEEVQKLIDERLHPELYQQLTDELREPLYNRLYEALYNALHDALYQPESETDNIFVPLI